MGNNHIALIAGQHVAVRALAEEYVEVVEPEIGHHFEQLALAVNILQQLAFHQFIADDLLRIAERQQRFLLLGTHARHHLVVLVASERRSQGKLVLRRQPEDRLHSLIGWQVNQLVGLEVGIKAVFALAGRRVVSLDAGFHRVVGR